MYVSALQLPIFAFSKASIAKVRKKTKIGLKNNSFIRNLS